MDGHRQLARRQRAGESPPLPRPSDAPADHAEPSCAQVSYYNGSLPVTHAGKLHMPVVKHYVAPMKDDTGMYLDGTEKFYQTAMIQTWNKFCFSQSGIVEMKARLPGKSTMPGLWPAFWIMGNLGRATLEDSTDGIWPFSYDECVEGGSEDCETS